MMEIIISQNENQNITIKNDNIQNINIKQNDNQIINLKNNLPQDININQPENQVILVDGGGSIYGFIDKNVNDLTYYTLTSNLGSVALSNDYNDLNNKPTIPTVNDGILTIQKNGSNIDTFTANSSANKTVNITVPTTTNELTNNSGFIDNSVNNLTNYTNNTNLASMFANFLKVVETTIPIGSISAQTGVYDQIYTLSVPSGYSLLGLVGYQFTGVGSASISLGRFIVRNTNQFVYSIYNTTTAGSSASNTNLLIYVLYVKN